MQGYALDLDGLADGIAGGAGNLGDDSGFVTCQTVEQAGFSDVGLPDQHDIQTLAQQGTLTSLREHRVELFGNAGQLPPGVCLLQEINVFFREIEGGFHQHAQLDQGILDTVDPARELAVQRTQRGARCFTATGVDQVGDSFRLHQIQLAVEEGASAEFTRLRQARSQLKATLQHALQYLWATVALQFEN